MFVIATKSIAWEDKTMTITSALPIPSALHSENPFFDPAIFADPAFSVRPQFMQVRRIGFLVYPNIEVLDLCGPLDVFVYADRFTRIKSRADEFGYEVLVIADKPGLVTTMCGVQITATHGLGDVIDGLDTLIVAGGIGVEQACAEPALIGWVKMMAPQCRRVASVCSGAYLLAAAGVLNNRRVTTHWVYCEHLAAAYPSLRVDPNLIYVRDGNVYTSGGITSGIDLALAM